MSRILTILLLMTSEANTSQHNPELISREARKKFDEDDIDGAKMIYQSALLDWVDDAREMSSSADSVTITRIKESIATLWVEYAGMYRQGKKFKAATETYEAAVNCTVAGSMGKVWGDYAHFQEERNRHKSAQKVYLRALVGVTDTEAAIADESERNLLWGEFLSMMKKLKKDDTLTMEKLRAAVMIEHVQLQNRSLSDNKDRNIDALDELQVFPHVPKRPRVNGNGQPPFPTEYTGTIKLKDVELSSDELIKLNEGMFSQISSEWHARDGSALPSKPEPPLFAPSPPKLADPSFMDILGTELALKLIRLLLHDTGNIILEVARGCWMMTALKENEARVRINALDDKLTEDIERKEAELDARLSVAGAATQFAVEQVNASEKSDLLAICNQQRQQLLVDLSWEFRHLFATLQQLLSNAGLPGFNGLTVDAASIHIQANTCAFLHSAFFLRSKIGEKQHLSMLKSQENRLAALPMKPISPLPPPNQTFAGAPGFPSQNYTIPPPPFPQQPSSVIYNTMLPTFTTPNHQVIAGHLTQAYPGQPHYPPPQFR